MGHSLKKSEAQKDILMTVNPKTRPSSMCLGKKTPWPSAPRTEMRPQVRSHVVEYITRKKKSVCFKKTTAFLHNQTDQPKNATPTTLVS